MNPIKYIYLSIFPSSLYIYLLLSISLFNISISIFTISIHIYCIVILYYFNFISIISPLSHSYLISQLSYRIIISLFSSPLSYTSQTISPYLYFLYHITISRLLLLHHPYYLSPISHILHLSPLIHTVYISSIALHLALLYMFY